MCKFKRGGRLEIEEIWEEIEKEIKDFTKSLIEAILENTIKEYLQLEKYQRSEQRIDYRKGKLIKGVKQIYPY